MPTSDASKLDLTLTLRQVPLPDGTTADWVIPPFDYETERSFWDWMQANDEHQSMQQAAAIRNRSAMLKGEALERVPIRTKGETWGELLAMAVKTTVPESAPLTAEYLAQSFSSLLLERLGVQVRDFFLLGQLPDDESTKS